MERCCLLRKQVLTLDALKEIRNLRVHINRGCLSNIPPGCGTERNENLHKCIRKKVQAKCALVYTWL